LALNFLEVGLFSGNASVISSKTTFLTLFEGTSFPKWFVFNKAFLDKVLSELMTEALQFYTFNYPIPSFFFRSRQTNGSRACAPAAGIRAIRKNHRSDNNFNPYFYQI